MNIINNLNLKNTLFTFKKLNIFYLALVCLFVLSCKRIVKVDKEEVAGSDDKEEVSTSKMQEIMALKLPLKTVTIDKRYNLTIPESATVDFAKIEPQEDTKIGKVGSIDLTKLPEAYLSVALYNTFTHHDELYDEYILIFKENDPKRLTIKDIKENFERMDFVYLEDENSIVFEQGDSFFTIHFDYDEANKAYIFYKAEMSWSKKYPKQQKVDLFLHLLKQAKNLTNHNYINTKFTSWDDYVKNSPVIEIEIAKGMFKKLEKELKIFLANDEKVSPKTPGNYKFVSLYRATKPKELAFYKFIDAVKTNQLSQLKDYDFGREIYDINSGNDYSVREQEGCYLINFSSKKFSGELHKSDITVICPMEYKNISFFIQTADEIPEADTDIFVKMFSYFSKNYTLDTKLN
ncbi:hypothetical protein [Pedobacter psychrodurus]|uniref:hypothetical protein n=1 Tax=Pedobacter psychrodurus TaxID=2530456 RepID=UPI00292FAEC5|nr:hypothetical protein [Pedobacter psychrodurus]